AAGGHRCALGRTAAAATAAFLVEVERDRHLAAQRGDFERHLERRLHALPLLRTAGPLLATAAEDRPEEITESAEPTDVELFHPWAGAAGTRSRATRPRPARREGI